MTGQTQPQTTRHLRSPSVTEASSLLRAGPPARPATVLTPGLTPGCSLSQTKPVHNEPISPHSIETRLPTFPARAADQAHAASMPDTTWPETGTPARPCSHGLANGHGFGATLHLTTRQQRFGVTHLPDPHLTPLMDAFSTSLTTTVFNQRSMWWFGASTRPATPKGQTFISCRTPIPESLTCLHQDLHSSFVAH